MAIPAAFRMEGGRIRMESLWVVTHVLLCAESENRGAFCAEERSTGTPTQ